MPIIIGTVLKFNGAGTCKRALAIKLLVERLPHNSTRILQVSWQKLPCKVSSSQMGVDCYMTNFQLLHSHSQSTSNFTLSLNWISIKVMLSRSLCVSRNWKSPLFALVSNRYCLWLKTSSNALSFMTMCQWYISFCCHRSVIDASQIEIADWEWDLASKCTS